ncbi:hypothetical protein NECAME_12635 [Necator americanus]|uniref:Uncharacterized protein n=1 Tax=Necator americanus TaxID=51031 RepID=W2T1R1_NECAM|nr:hypothetical protein NECAME_12635 [Necator americanus]ETN74912.1 hypothetical protein NECAME_12635 [Necator americanus]
MRLGTMQLITSSRAASPAASDSLMEKYQKTTSTISVSTTSLHQKDAPLRERGANTTDLRKENSDLRPNGEVPENDKHHFGVYHIPAPEGCTSEGAWSEHYGPPQGEFRLKG